MDDPGGLRDLRRLRLVGVGAPIVFIVGFEVFRHGILETVLPEPVANVIAVAVGVVLVLAFGLVMFFHIERAQRQVVRQNRDLGVVNAVSLAIQGELDVGRLLEVGVHQLMRSTGAADARLSAPRLDPDAGADRELVLTDEGPSEDAFSAPGRVVEVPLASSTGHLGLVRLTVPAGAVATLPSPAALATVGHQLAAALQIGELVGDLRRQRIEGQTIYQSLLEISNQAPLLEILGAIVRGAEERLAADEGRICLTDTVIDALQGDRALVGGLVAGVGTEGAEGSDSEVTVDPIARPHRCPIGHSSGYAATLHVPIWTPGELLGDLWLGRRTGEAFSERDRRYLETLAGIAAIAITAARLRENERQGAILSERDRIARELHDSLAQVLGSTHLRLRALLARQELKGTSSMARIAAELDELAEVAHDAYQDVREAILGLREASHPRGFLEGLEAYVAKFAQQSGVNVELETATDGEPALATSREIQLIRVVQEALTNVRKHSQASSARVKVMSTGADGGMTVVVEDDGRGFDPRLVGTHREGGYGLQTMRERMELVGGTLRIDSRPGHGTRIVAFVPGLAKEDRPAPTARAPYDAVAGTRRDPLAGEE